MMAAEQETSAARTEQELLGNIGNTGGVSRENSYNINGDPLFLQNSDHPGMVLVTAPLTGNNYFAWSRSMKIALGAKVKLGFINGKCEMPDEDSPNFEQWTRVDCMVRSWILNSISKEIVEAFLCTSSARELWSELEERFGESNGPLLYQLQREISSISQGSMTVVQYYTKLQKLWDELNFLMPIPQCDCGAAKLVSDITSLNRLMQFLMGLNESFDHIRNQILLMDPLPTVNKVYSMVLRVEKQREVHLPFTESTENVALAARSQDFKKDGGFGRGGFKRTEGNRRANKKDLHCEHCNMGGHTKETCFKIHGYPDWYKQLKEQKGQVANRPVAVANAVDTPLDIDSDMLNAKGNEQASNLTSMIQHEIMKLMKGKMPVGVVNLPEVIDSGEASCSYPARRTWAMSNGNKAPQMVDEEREENIDGKLNEISISHKSERHGASEDESHIKKNEHDNVHGANSYYLIDNLPEVNDSGEASCSYPARRTQASPVRQWMSNDISESSTKLPPPVVKDKTRKGKILEARSKMQRSRFEKPLSTIQGFSRILKG